MKHRFTLLYFFVFFVISVQAQQLKDAEAAQRWQQAQKMYEEGRYNLAIENLKPIAAYRSDNSYAQRANYLFALCLYRQDDLVQAQGAIETLLQKHSEWRSVDEAYYLAGVIAAERKKWHKAMQYWQYSYTDNLRGDTDNAKLKLLASISTDSLRLLQSQYSADRALALLLVQKLITEGNKADKHTIDKLVNSFDFKEFQQEIVANMPQNKEMSVGLLLPFMHRNVNPKIASKSVLPAIDFYEGMRLAVEDLASLHQLVVKLHSYDTEKNANTIKDILSLTELTENQLLVGPIYPQGTTEIADFAAKHQIPLVNPLTIQRPYDANNTWAFMTESTAETQAQQVANYAVKNFSGDKVAIIYGVSPKDTMMAFSYKQQMEAQGKNIVLYRQVGKNSAANLIKFLVQAGVDSATSHIFVPNDESLVKIQFIGALGLLHLKVPVITYDTWLQSTDYTFEEFQRRHVHFIASSYANDDNDEVKRFKRRYLEKVKLVPSIRAFQGYEMMMYFGKMYALHGKDFIQKMRAAGYQKGFLFSGFDYSKGNDNQFVPLFKLEDLNMKLVNVPTAE